MENKIKKALEKGDVSKVRKLVGRVTQNNVQTTTQMAVCLGSCEILEVLPSNWFLADFKRPLLHLAVKQRHDSIVRFLLGRGLPVNVQDTDGNTPLYEACMTQNINVLIIRLLIENGADPAIKNAVGQSAMDLLNRKGELKVIEQINKLQISLEERVNILEDNWSIIQDKFDVLATKADVQSMANLNENYVHLMTKQNSFDQLESGQFGSSDITLTPQLSRIRSNRNKEQLYSYLDCDFLVPNGNNRRRFSPEEEHHIRSKLTHMVTHLRCMETISDICDRMYATEALNFPQVQFLRRRDLPIKELVRYIIIDVIIAGGKLFRFLEFVDALKQLKEEKMVKFLMNRDLIQPETISVKL